MSRTFVVCQNKATERVALIPEDEINVKEWLANGQVIEASDWQGARNQVDESNLYKSPIGGDYFYVNI